MSLILLLNPLAAASGPSTPAQAAVAGLVRNTHIFTLCYQEQPAAVWRLGESVGATSIHNETPAVLDGTVTGTVTFGQSGWPADADPAALFDGSTGFITVPHVAGNALDLTGRVTIVAVVKFSSTTGAGFVISKSAAGIGGYELSRKSGTGQIEFSISDATGSYASPYVDIVTPASYNDGLYHLVVAVHDPIVAQKATIYIDGAPVASSAGGQTGSPVSTTAPFVLGARGPAGGTGWFAGTIDDVAMYPYAWSSAQVLALFNARLRVANSKALMQARSGFIKAGQTRSDYFLQQLVVLIGGADQSSRIWKDSLRATDVLNEQSDTATLQVFGLYPAPGQSIVLATGAANNRFFGGTIVRTRQVSVPQAGGQQAVKVTELECTDWTWLLNRRRVTKQYAAGTLANVAFIDVITLFTSGFTTANVKAPAPALTAPLVFIGTTVMDALTQIAQAVGWNFYPDPFQDLHFFDTESTAAPKPLSPVNAAYDSLDYASDLTQIRTRVLVSGGGGQTTAPVGTGAVTIPVNECAQYSATGGSVISPGGDIVTYSSRGPASGPGTLTGVPASGVGSVQHPLLQGDTLAVWVVVNDLAAQAALAALEGGDGIHEDYLSVSGGTIAMCTQAGTATLAAYKNVDIRGSCVSYDKQMRSGKLLQIKLPARNLNVTVTVQRVTRRPLTYGRWAYDVDFAVVWRDLVTVLTRIGA